MSNSPQTLDMAALVAAAAARQATDSAPARSAKVRDAAGKPVYGVFITPCGHVIAVDYTAQGKVRMDSWGTYRKDSKGKLTRVATHRRKVDALDALDAARTAATAEAPAAAEATAAE